jgi:hypothetical protein
MKQTIFLEMQKQHMVQKIYYLKKGVGVGTSRFSSLSNLAVSWGSSSNLNSFTSCFRSMLSLMLSCILSITL